MVSDVGGTNLVRRLFDEEVHRSIAEFGRSICSVQLRVVH